MHYLSRHDNKIPVENEFRTETLASVSKCIAVQEAASALGSATRLLYSWGSRRACKLKSKFQNY